MSQSNPVLNLPAAGSGAPNAPATSPARLPKSKPVVSRETIIAANAPQTGLLSHIHGMHLVVIFFCVIQVVLGAVAVATNNWYAIVVNNGVTYYGLFQQCDSTNSCKDITFQDYFFSPVCTKSGSELQSRFTAVKVLAIGGVCGSFITLIVAAVAKKLSSGPLMSGIVVVFTFLTLAGLFAAALLFAITMDRWWFCDRNICDLMRALGNTSACDGSYGYSLGFLCIAVGSAFLAFIFSGVRVALGEWDFTVAKAGAANEPTSATPNKNVGAKDAGSAAQRSYGDSKAQPSNNESDQYAARGWDNNAQSTYQEQRQPQQESGGTAVVAGPPPGDWVWDANSGMYWSQQEYLYLDPTTRHCYDPNSDMWYDPDLEEWYRGVS